MRAYEGEPDRFPGITVNAAFLHSVFGKLSGEKMSPKDLERATKCLMRGSWRRGTGRCVQALVPTRAYGRATASWRRRHTN